MMSDELDIAYDKTTCIMGSTDTTVDQGGSGGSTAMERDAWPMRRAAAEARRVLLEMGSARLGAPVDQLARERGRDYGEGRSLQARYLRRTDRRQEIQCHADGNNVNATTGVAQVKPVTELKFTGQSPQRYDIPAKVDGSLKWAVDVKLPGMVHARNVKPPFAGAKLISIDESSVRSLPGFIKVVNKGNYVAVVCEREEQAINAARQLKTNWEKPATAPFPSSENLFKYMRDATPTSSSNPIVVGNPDAALAGAAKVIEADYDIPFQGHTAIVRAHAMADPSNGQMTIYSNDMKSYGMRTGVAAFLGMPREKVRVVWMEGPQGFGRTAADDAGCEAAYLAKEIGRPVRIQWMRNEETAWDTKAPAFVVKVRGGLDAAGNLVAYEYNALAARLQSRRLQRARYRTDRTAHGLRRAQPAAGSSATPSEMYAIPHRRMAGDVVSLPLVWETPLRTGNLRDPNGPQSTFAAESFIDELAAAAKADPLEFRMKLLTAATDRRQRVPARALDCGPQGRSGNLWLGPRPSPKPRGTGNILTGRGVAYSFRGQTMVAQIAEVEVNRQTGHVWAKRLVCAHDCGLVVNPREPASHGGMRHAAWAEPRDSGRSPVRYGKGHQRGLDVASHSDACRRAGKHRRRAGERRSQSEPARSASLWRRRGGVQADARGDRERYL